MHFNIPVWWTCLTPTWADGLHFYVKIREQYQKSRNLEFYNFRFLYM